MNKSRTEYSVRNASVAIAARVCAILAGFITRIVFTHTIRQEYVGISSLFSDILNALAFSESGIDTAVSFALYAPIAKGDKERQKSLMYIFRNFCRIAAFFIFAVGILMIPFVNLLVKDYSKNNDLIFVYLLYLMNCAVSYLMAYKKILTEAHQLGYINMIYQMGSLVLQNILQMMVLLFTGNFLLFVSVMSLCTVLNNAAISKKADTLYPYLKDKDVQEIPKKEKNKIYQNIYSMLLHKLGMVSINNTDNILLSVIVGIISNSIYSNYYLIIGSVRQILNQIFRGIIASVGNLGAQENRGHIQKIYEASFFGGQWIFGLSAICIFEIIDIFIEICFGKNYVFSQDVTLILCLNFYFTGMRQATLVFHESLGIFVYDRYKSVAEVLINLVSSILLGRYFGALGVFLGTLTSMIAVSLWIEPYVLYKHYLKTSCSTFFLRYGLYVLITLLLWYGEDVLCRHVSGCLAVICIKRIIICVIVTNLAYLLLYHRTEEFKLLADKGKMLLKRYFICI